MSDSLQLHGLHSPWNSSGQNTEVGSLSLLQGIFPTEGSNPGLPHCRLILYQLSHKGSARILEWLDYPFSSRSSRLRNWTRVSCIAGGFFTSRAIREALRHGVDYQQVLRNDQWTLLPLPPPGLSVIQLCIQVLHPVIPGPSSLGPTPSSICSTFPFKPIPVNPPLQTSSSFDHTCLRCTCARVNSSRNGRKRDGWMRELEVEAGDNVSSHRGCQGGSKTEATGPDQT